MPIVSGRLIFDINRTASANVSDSGLANVPIVLQDIDTDIRLVVLTDAIGNYSFLNVPNGNYRIVEAFGTLGGVPTPGDFNTADVGQIPIGQDPPISFAINPPPGTTTLDSLTPNTIFATVADIDLIDENFLDGPVIYTPVATILDPCTILSPINIITAADNGTFGSFPPGTPANTGPAAEPYPGVTPDFIYVVPDPSDFTPIDGEYTVQNIMTDAMSNVIGAWWRIADHTVGDETGRMMVVNGFDPGAVFFQQVVSVTTDTSYLFTTWILNLFKEAGFPPPQLGVEILDQSGNRLFFESLGNEIPVNAQVPEWKEIGTVINSGNNSSLTVRFFSQGEAAIGNDYAIDDVSLREIDVPKFTPVKSISQPTANVGEIITYTVTITNTCMLPLTGVFFEDIIPNGLVFISGSVTINEVLTPGINPNIGFELPDVFGGQSITVTFDAEVAEIPSPNPANNTATINYSYSPVQGGIPNTYSLSSNNVELLVDVPFNILINKTTDKQFADLGDIITYTVTLTNAGTTSVNNALFQDATPSGTFFVEGSLSVSTEFTGTAPASGLTITTINPGQTALIIWQIQIGNAIPEPNPISNTATITLPGGIAQNSNTVTTTVNNANIVIDKRVNKLCSKPCGILTYTLILSNNGNVPANDVILTDYMPKGVCFVRNSLRINDMKILKRKFCGTTIFTSIAPGEIVTVSFKVKILKIRRPSLRAISNTAKARFQYEVTPQQLPAVKINKSNTVTTIVCSC